MSLPEFDQRDGMVLRAYPVEKREEDLERYRAFVAMPVGTKVLGVLRVGVGMRVMALTPRIQGARVLHGLVLAAPEEVITPRLGERFGEPLDFLILGDEPVAVLPVLPWPEVARG
jgi:hypothetical protein